MPDVSMYLDSVLVTVVVYLILMVVGDNLGLNKAMQAILSIALGVLHHYKGYMVFQFITGILASFGLK